MRDTDRASLPGKSRQWEALILTALAVAALIIGWTLTAGNAALAGPSLQDSPIAAPQERLSPLPTAAATVEAGQPDPTAVPAPESPAAQPSVPIGVLIGVMAVIGLAALIIGLRRR